MRQREGTQTQSETILTVGNPHIERRRDHTHRVRVRPLSEVERAHATDIETVREHTLQILRGTAQRDDDRDDERAHGTVGKPAEST